MNLVEVKRPVAPSDYPLLVYRPGLCPRNPAFDGELWSVSDRDDNAVLDADCRAFKIPTVPPKAKRRTSKGEQE